MGRILFKDTDIILDAQSGSTLSACIRQAGLAIETPCNCIGKCGKCRVVAVGDLYPPDPAEAMLLDGEENIRLACMARIRGDAEVQLLQEPDFLKTVNLGFSKEFAVCSDTARIFRPAPDGLAALEEVVFGDVVLETGQALGLLLGVAIDIGTTGVSAYLVDLERGDVLSRESCLNPQTQFGSDVLSRISYSMNHPEGSAALKKTIIDKINVLVPALLQSSNNPEARIGSIYRMTIAGNTTMLHFLTGAETASIARAPYTPVFIDRLDMPARELDVAMHRNGIITLLPSASGYVGADILAGVVATAFDEKNHPALFIDIGTNGEIVARSGGKLAATSTAAGPALEGMNISCGCRAEAGAIDSFHMDADYSIRWTTIGDKPPKGICGSGLIDLMACLVRKGMVLPSGKLRPEVDSRIDHRLRDKKFYITEDIYLSQKDIRQIQLAKGAIAAGVVLLLDQINVPLEAVREAVIAGSFGYHLNPDSLLKIGLIPKGFQGRITFVGNSSVEGARMALLNRDALAKMTELQGSLTVLELSTSDRFQDVFVKELGF